MSNFKGNKALDFLNDQSWHDSILYEINIIRTQSADQVIITLNLIVDEKEWKSQHISLTFNECHYIETKMNGGIGCMSDGEMISSASANFQGKYVDQVREEWKKFKIQSKELFQFEMSLASTGSEIYVVCNSFDLVSNHKIVKHNAPPQIATIR